MSGKGSFLDPFRAEGPAGGPALSAVLTANPSLSAGTSSMPLGPVVFSNSNNVSFGLSGSTVTASAALSVSAGTLSAARASLVFSNSNGVSFGLNGSTITASVGAGGAAGSISAGTTSVALGQVVFSNANGISFGLNGSTVTGSVAAETATGNFGGLAGGTQTATSGTVVFSNSNGISFGLSGSSRMTASYDAITRMGGEIGGAISAQVVSLRGGNNNVSVSAPNASRADWLVGGINTISAGASSASVGTDLKSLVFSNSNGIGFGLSTAGNTWTITASYTVPTQSVQTQSLIAAVYDGANSISTGTIRLTNANGVSFSINGQTLSGSVAAGATATGNLGAIAAGTQTATSGTVVFSDSNGMSFGLSGSTRMTASFQAIKSVSAGTTRVTGGEVVFSDSNGLAFGVNGNTVTASYTVPTVPGAVALAAGTQTATSGTVVFSNSNNITFGMSGSTRVTASFDPILTLAASGGALQSVTQRTVLLLNGFGTTDTNAFLASFFTTDNGAASSGIGARVTMTWPSLSAGVSTGGNSTGSTGAVSNLLVFAGGNNITLSQSTGGVSSATITVSADGPLHSVTWGPWPGANSVASQLGNASLFFAPFLVDGRIVATHMRQFVSNTITTSSNSSHGGTLSAGFGVYTKNASTLSLMFSGSTTLAWTNTSNNSTAELNGLKDVTISFAQTTLTGGDYWLGWWSRTSSANSNGFTMSNLCLSDLTNQFNGPLLGTTNNTRQLALGMGVYTATTTGVPSSLGFSQVHGGSAAGINRRPYFQLNGATV